MLFIVDGYNVTRSDPAARSLTLEQQRDALVARLRARGREMLGSGEVLVLFDGAEGTGAGTQSDTGSYPVRVVFAREGSADNAIVVAVARASGKVVVVSNDRELAERVRAHAPAGIEVLPASACFDSAGRGSARKGRRPHPRRDVGLPAGAHQITQELKSIWLTGNDE